MLSGIDVSHFQGQIDWDTVKKNANFAFIQSSYGNGYTDPQFIRNRDEVRRVGLPHGFYHYAYPQYNQPQAEAYWFLKTIQKIEPEEILALDFEENYPDPVNWCKSFLDFVSSYMKGYKPLLYINANQMNSYDWSPVANAGYGLWLAEYNEKPEETSPLKYWNIVALHQWTSSEKVPGITGNVDGDSFFGDEKAFASYGYTISTPATPAVDYKGFYDSAKGIVNGSGFAWNKVSAIKDLIVKIGV